MKVFGLCVIYSFGGSQLSLQAMQKHGEVENGKEFYMGLREGKVNGKG